MEQGAVRHDKRPAQMCTCSTASSPPHRTALSPCPLLSLFIFRTGRVVAVALLECCHAFIISFFEAKKAREKGEKQGISPTKKSKRFPRRRRSTRTTQQWQWTFRRSQTAEQSRGPGPWAHHNPGRHAWVGRRFALHVCSERGKGAHSHSDQKNELSWAPGRAAFASPFKQL